MATSNAARRHSNARGFWLIFLMSGLLVVMLAGVTLAAAPSVGFAAAVSPTSHVIPWAPVQILKPTYTPSPIPTATLLPTETATPTVEVDAATTGIDTSISLEYKQPSPELSQAPADPNSGQYILVSISEQHLSAYENGQLIYSFVASTGMHSATRIGSFRVLDKIPNAYGSTWNIWMPEWMGIYYSGTLENGIHALPILPNGDTLWAGFLGTPISYGCVVLGTSEAEQLYNWAEIGTPVEIRW